MIPTPFVGHKCSIPPSEELPVCYGVNIPLGVRILAVFEGFVKDLVFPHVQIKNHDEEYDAVIEPLARNINVQRFSSTAPRDVKIERI